jgi:hypothetical protein
MGNLSPLATDCPARSARTPENANAQTQTLRICPVIGRAALIGALTMNKPTEYWIPIEASSGFLVLLGEGLEPSVEWHTWDEPILPSAWLDLTDIVRWALSNGYLDKPGVVRFPETRARD